MNNKIRLWIYSLMVMGYLLISENSCKNDEDNPSAPNTVSDIDGNVYQTVTIGTQVWMVENLNTTTYRNGDRIPNLTDGSAWKVSKNGAFCDYENNSNNSKTYGRLYNWYAINSGNLSPIGWHIPNDAEWTTLTTYLGGENIAGGKLKETGTLHWFSPNTDATNVTGFTALPGAYRGSDGYFSSLGNSGLWWSSTEYLIDNAEIRLMHSNANYVDRNNYRKWSGLSVRCLKD